MHIGLAIRTLRKERNVTLVQIEKATGVTVSTLSRVENGETQKMDIESVVHIAEFLNVPIADLIEVARKLDADGVRAKQESLRAMTRDLRAEIEMHSSKYCRPVSEGET